LFLKLDDRITSRFHS